MKDIYLPGRGRPILLLHGLRGNPLELFYLAQRLHAAGHTLSVPYLEGYGQRPGDATPVADREAWEAAALAALAALEQTHGPVVVGGLCIGANLALRLARRSPYAVAGLLLISTTLFYDGWNQPFYRCLLPLAGRTPLRHWYRVRERAPYGVKNPRIREWIARQMERTGNSAAGARDLPLAAVHEAYRLMRQVRADLPAVTAPALVLHAREDEVASLRSAGLLAQRLGAERIELRIFNDSYHMLTIDNDREGVAQACAGFVASLPTWRAQAPQAALA